MDKFDSGFCVNCGGVLLDLKAPLQMCSQCIRIVEADAAKKIKNRKGAPIGKRVKMHIGLLAKAQNV